MQILVATVHLIRSLFPDTFGFIFQSDFCQIFVEMIAEA